MQITARTRPLLGQDTLMRAMFSGDNLTLRAEQMILRGDRDGGLGFLK